MTNLLSQMTNVSSTDKGLSSFPPDENVVNIFVVKWRQMFTVIEARGSTPTRTRGFQRFALRNNNSTNGMSMGPNCGRARRHPEDSQGWAPAAPDGQGLLVQPGGCSVTLAGAAPASNRSRKPLQAAVTLSQVQKKIDHVTTQLANNPSFPCW